MFQNIEKAPPSEKDRLKNNYLDISLRQGEYQQQTYQLSYNASKIFF